MLPRAAGLDDLEKRQFIISPGLELRPLGRPTSRYTDYATPAPVNYQYHLILIKFVIWQESVEKLRSAKFQEFTNFTYKNTAWKGWNDINKLSAGFRMRLKIDHDLFVCLLHVFNVIYILAQGMVFTWTQVVPVSNNLYQFYKTGIKVLMKPKTKLW
jgi:hypothetical protein